MNAFDPFRRPIAPHIRASLQRLGIFAVFLACVVPVSFAGAQCDPPPDLSKKFQTNPTAETYSSIGQWFAEQKRFVCAARAFASASELQPQSASLAYLWGLSLFSAGQGEAALAPLDRSAQLNPNDIRPHLARGAALDGLSRIGDAKKEWRAALAIDPDSAAALEGLSQDLVSESDYASVIALLDRPGKVRAFTSIESLNLGIAYARTAQLRQATAVLREGLSNDSDSIAIADELALVLMLTGRDQEAYAVLELAIGKHPDDQGTQLLYLRALVSSHSDKAGGMAQRLLTVSPNHWEVQYLNGVLASRDGDYLSARSFLERSIALNGNNSEAHADLGSALAQLGDLSGAKEHLEKAIALGDTEPEVEFNLARVLQRQGDTAQAQEKLRIYQQLKNARSDRVQAAGKAEEGDQAMTAGDSVKAAALFREALQTDPDEPLIHYKLAKALDRMQDTAGETVELDRAIQLNPNLAEAQNQRGYLAVRGDDAAKAEDCFRAAVRASPSFAAAWINLAATLASETRWQEARQAVSRALEIDPDNAQARRLDQALTEAHAGP
jgi:tetratricopeptide (TPR) repeat protein